MTTTTIATTITTTGGILGTLNPIEHAEAWHTVSIASVISPGVCIVGEFKRAHEWDVKKGKGSLGATITFVQRPPAKGSLKFLLWTAAHFRAWDAFLPLFKYNPTKKQPDAVEIAHPSLFAIDLHSVVVESISNPVHQGKGLYQITVELLEFFPPPKASAVGTPKKALSNSDAAEVAVFNANLGLLNAILLANLPPDPNQQLLDQAKQLGNQLAKP